MANVLYGHKILINRSTNIIQHTKSVKLKDQEISFVDMPKEHNNTEKAKKCEISYEIYKMWCNKIK